jgi:hypothetical protein
MAKTLAVVVSILVAASVLLATYSPVNEPEAAQLTIETEKAEMPAIFTTDCTE